MPGLPNSQKTEPQDTKNYTIHGTSTTIQLQNGNDTIGRYAKLLKQEKKVFKGLVIEYGYYVIAGVVASIIQHSLGLSLFQFWTIVFVAIGYYLSLQYVHHLAWGEED